MISLILRRLLALLPVLLGISLLSFLLIQLAPGDYLSQMSMDPSVSRESLEGMRREFGLDKPAWQQYAIYLKNIVLKGDFGYSFSRRDVWRGIRQRLARPAGGRPRSRGARARGHEGSGEVRDCAARGGALARDRRRS